MSAVRCTRRYCGSLMEAVVVAFGSVEFHCAPCARNQRGVCRDCPRALGRKGRLRCPACAKRRALAADRERDRERYPVRRAAVLEQHRRRGEIPEVREHRRLYMRDYRAARPRDGFDRAYMRAYMAMRRSDPVYRAKEQARKRAWRAKARAA